MENKNNENYGNDNQNSQRSKDSQNPKRHDEGTSKYNENERSDLSKQAIDKNKNNKDDFHANDSLKQDRNSDRREFKDTDSNRND